MGSRPIDSELYVEIPYWLFMLPFAALLLWWFWCPPGWVFPLLTVRRLIVLVAAAAVVLACFAILWHATEESRVKDRIKNIGGTLNRLDPSIYQIYLKCSALQTESDLARLRTATASLSGFQELYLGKSHALTDQGLKYLEGFTELHKLDLTDTRVTQAGVESLQRALPDTEILSDFPIAGAGPAPAGENR